MFLRNQLLSGIAVFLVSVIAHGYYSVMETAEIIPLNYQIQLEGQFVTKGNTGTNGLLRLTKRIDSQSSVQFQLGAPNSLGAGLRYKRIFSSGQDTDWGTGIDAQYIRFGDEKQMHLRFFPVMSHKVITTIGELTPYLAVPLGMRYKNSDELLDKNTVKANEFTAQLSAGSYLNMYDWAKHNISLVAEMGFSITNAESYFSVGFNYQFADFSSSSFKKLKPDQEENWL